MYQGLTGRIPNALAHRPVLKCRKGLLTVTRGREAFLAFHDPAPPQQHGQPQEPLDENRRSTTTCPDEPEEARQAMNAMPEAASLVNGTGRDEWKAVGNTATVVAFTPPKRRGRPRKPQPVD